MTKLNVAPADCGGCAIWDGRKPKRATSETQTAFSKISDAELQHIRHVRNPILDRTRITD